MFSGEITPDDYNKAWWDLRLKYQGIAPPSARGEEFFDPGAKYHVPDNTPYTRYFLADILQFQFHRALAKTAGCTLPLHRCSIYESKAAGERLNAMLSMGQSRPWPDALEALTGREADGRDGDPRLLRAARRSGSTSSSKARKRDGDDSAAVAVLELLTASARDMDRFDLRGVRTRRSPQDLQGRLCRTDPSRCRRLRDSDPTRTMRYRDGTFMRRR